MIEFLSLDEREKWHKVVRAMLNGRPATAEAAVKYADYVLEQDRERSVKLVEHVELRRLD